MPWLFWKSVSKKQATVIGKQADKAAAQKPPAPVRAVGIDLGTTFSAVAYVENGEAKMIHNRQVHDLYLPEITPSVVYFDKGRPLVGEEAVIKRRDDSSNTIFNIKRLIGRMYNDKFLQQQRWTFKIFRDSITGKACVKVGEMSHQPEEISSIILKEMRKIAKDVLFAEPTDAVITVPANFSNAQREATKRAGALAGLNVLQMVNEPTAAAIAFCAQNGNDNRLRRVLVFDLGGGTFDVSIVEIEGKQLAVVATDGLTTLGGADFDEKIYEEAVNRYRQDGIKISGGPGGAKDDWILMEACENAKIALSSRDSTTIVHSRHGSASFVLTLARFVELCDYLFRRTIALTAKVIRESALEEDEIEEILLVGGSTQIPRIRKLLAERFPRMRLRYDIEPQLVVAQGAAYLADSISKKRESKNASSDKEISASNDSELSSEAPFVLEYDIAPLHIGLRLGGDKCKKLIPRKTRIPFSSYELITKVNNDQKILTIEILEGNDEIASNNDSIAKFDIEVPPSKEGKTTIKVLVSMDVNGILSVSAIEYRTNKIITVTECCL